MSSDLDPTVVMAAHEGHARYANGMCLLRPPNYDGRGHCDAWRTADALAVEQARVARVEALCDRAQMHDNDGFKMTYVSWIREALADQPVQL